MALEFVSQAESLVSDSNEILEPSGPCPMPEGWRVAFFRGSAMLMTESWPQAEFWLDQAERLQPTAEGANNLGVVTARKGKRPQAQRLFMRSLDRFPEYSDARANRDAEMPSRITLHPLRREPTRGDYQ